MSCGSSGPGNASNLYNVSVIRLGQVGHGLAPACASAGHNVLTSDRGTCGRFHFAFGLSETSLRIYDGLMVRLV